MRDVGIANVIDNHSHYDLPFAYQSRQEFLFLIMYVCICKGITEFQIRTAVEDGAVSLYAVRNALGVASQCGQCRDQTREIVRQTLLNNSNNEQLFCTNNCALSSIDRASLTDTV